MEPTRLHSHKMNGIIYRGCYIQNELKGGEEIEPGGEEVEQEPQGRHGALGRQLDQHNDRYRGG